MTIREIAAIAGVSPAAVSLVINNKKGVSAETRRHIQSIMEECGYVPAPVRRKADRFRLRILKFRAHGIALEENQGFTASIIDRIESECRRFAFDLVMCNCEPATAATTIRSLMENPPDGVILIGTELREADYELFKLFTVPFVVLDNNILLENVDSVVMANRELTAQLVRYLYSLGHREIQYYKFTQPVNNCDERYEGYLQELHRLGLEPPEPIMLKPTVDGAFEDMKRLIKGGEYVPHGAAIADNLVAMVGLACPVVSVVIGEGGSGGALGLGVADRVWMLENAVYSVISPEGCASILYKDASKAPEAAAALGLTADKLLELGIIDRIVSEGTGSPTDVAANLREALVPTLDELACRPTDALLQERYEKFRQMGVATICSR